jgi:hypothetical protein
VTAAVVALAVALAAAVGGLIALGLKALDAERRCGNARSDEAALAVRLVNMTAQRDDETRRADNERTRADALDDALAEAALANAGPVDGAFGRLLQTWTSARAKAGAGQGAVPDASNPSSAAEADRPGSDDLLNPWKPA